MEKTAKYLLAIVVLLACVLLSQRNCLAQTMEHLFQQRNDILDLDQRRSSAPARAAYFVYLGEKEVVLLNAKKRLAKLTEEEESRLVALSRTLEPLKVLKIGLRNGDVPNAAEAIRTLSQNLEFSQSVFDAIGPARAKELVQGTVHDALITSATKKGNGPFSQSVLLLDKRLSQYLGLSDKQKKQISSLASSFEEKLKAEPSDLLKQIDKLTKDHWESINAELSPVQKKVASRIIGQPVAWHKCPSATHVRHLHFEHNARQYYCSKIYKLADELELRIKDLTSAQLERINVTQYHSHLVIMLESPFIWDELELTTNQRNEARSTFRNHYRADGMVVSNQYRQRLRELVATDDIGYPDFIEGWLTQQQLEWLQRVEFQVMTNQQQSSFGVLNTIMAEKLRLNDEQKTKIQFLSQKYKIARDKLELKLAETRKTMVTEFRNSVIDVLTPEQKSMFTAITGADIKNVLVQPKNKKNGKKNPDQS